MERSKLKLTVIFLLTVLDLFLLGSACSATKVPRLRPHHPDADLVYLERNGIEVQQETIPWESGLSARREDMADQILPDSEWPAQGLPDNCEVQPAREPATLLMDFVRGLSELGQTCETIHGIQEGYWYSGEEDRAVLTPCGRLRPTRGPFCWTVPRGFDQGDVGKRQPT
ncbi:MAG: hypothetical protein ACLT9P_09515 [Evtepia gabavorous]